MAPKLEKLNEVKIGLNGQEWQQRLRDCAALARLRGMGAF